MSGICSKSGCREEMEMQELTACLDKDREMLMSQMKSDPSREHALKVMDRELERLILLSSESSAGDEAGHILTAARETLPMINAVSGVEEWKKTGKKEKGFRPGPLSLSLLIAGFAAILIGRGSSLSSVLLTVLGAGALAAGAFLLSGSRKSNNSDRAGQDLERRFLIDPAEAYRVIRAVTATADYNLKERRSAQALTESLSRKEQLPDDVGLYAELLEYAYRLSRQEESRDTASEMISQIRFKLHSYDISLLDYSPDNGRSFELLPGGSSMTIRPALIRNGELLVKGLASV